VALKGLYYAMWRQQVGERPLPSVQEPDAETPADPDGAPEEASSVAPTDPVR
jgi:ATP-binding cassette subfamily B protein